MSKPLVDCTTGTLHDHLQRARAALAAANDPVRLVLFVGAVSEVVAGGVPRYVSPSDFTRLVETMVECRWRTRGQRLAVLGVLYENVLIPEWTGWTDG